MTRKEERRLRRSYIVDLVLALPEALREAEFVESVTKREGRRMRRRLRRLGRQRMIAKHRWARANPSYTVEVLAEARMRARRLTTAALRTTQSARRTWTRAAALRRVRRSQARRPTSRAPWRIT